MKKKKYTFSEILENITYGIKSNKFLIYTLIIPLLIGSILFIFLSKLRLFEILGNLSTDLITIIITILYVEWVLKKRDDLIWKNANIFVTSEIGSFSHGVISDLVKFIHLESQIYNKDLLPNLLMFQENIIKNAKTIEKKVIAEHIRNLEKDEWGILYKGITSHRETLLSLLSIFGRYIKPDQIELLLMLRQSIKKLQSQYELFEQFAGIPITRLPNVKDGKPWEYAELNVDLSTLHVKEILTISVDIIQSFSFKLPEKIEQNEDEIKELYDPIKLPF